MSSMPDLSVVTVSFNSAATIARTIESVRAQSLPNLEYIVVDGGSTDGTLDIVKRSSDVVTTLISEPDEGIYDAMNKGIRRSRGTWIHILNSDDFYAEPGILARALRSLDPARTNYFAMWRLFEDGRRSLQTYRYRRWPLYVSAFLPHPSLIVSRSQYDEAGLYETRYRIAADHDMILRLTARWPGLAHALPLTVMTQGGYSERHMDAALAEFRRVTVANGLPEAVAGSLYRFRKLWWRMRR